MTTMAFTLRTDAELEAALAELSEARGVSKQEIARAAILEMQARSQHRSKVASASSASRDRWGDVLDRLGSV